MDSGGVPFWVKRPVLGKTPGQEEQLPYLGEVTERTGVTSTGIACGIFAAEIACGRRAW